jgi:hypothetical protein
MDIGDHNLDLPFEPQQPTPGLQGEHVHYSGGVVVMAAVVDVPGAGKKPALVFRFAEPTTGQFYPAFCLVQDDDQMAKLRPLINEAIAQARRGAQL